MFDSVLKSGRRSGERLSKGAIASIVVHVGLIAAVIVFMSGESRSETNKKKDHTEVTFKENVAAPKVEPAAPPAAEAPAPLPLPPPPSPTAPAVTDVKKPEKKPAKKPPAPKPGTVVTSNTPAPARDPEPSNTPPGTPGLPGGDPNGSADGKIGGSKDGKPGGTGDGPPGGGNQVLPFGEGMTRPKRISGRDPQYTREALEAKVSGLMIVRCVIELDGSLQKCKVIKALPYMEKAVLDALETHRYTPVTFQGQPTRVDYTFNIKLVAPE